MLDVGFVSLMETTKFEASLAVCIDPCVCDCDCWDCVDDDGSDDGESDK